MLKQTGDGSHAHRRYMLGSVAYGFCAVQLAGLAYLYGGLWISVGCVVVAALSYWPFLRVIDLRNQQINEGQPPSTVVTVTRYGLYSLFFWLCAGFVGALIYFAVGHCNMTEPQRAQCVANAQRVGVMECVLAALGYLTLLWRVRNTQQRRSVGHPMIEPTPAPTRGKWRWLLYVGLSLLWWFLILQVFGVFVVINHCYVAAAAEKARCYAINNLVGEIGLVVGIIGNCLLVHRLNKVRERASSERLLDDNRDAS